MKTLPATCFRIDEVVSLVSPKQCFILRDVMRRKFSNGRRLSGVQKTAYHQNADDLR